MQVYSRSWYKWIKNNIITVCRYIVGVDINDSKFAAAVSMGATECVNSMSCEGGDVKSWLLARKSSFYLIFLLLKGLLLKFQVTHHIKLVIYPVSDLWKISSFSSLKCSILKIFSFVSMARHLQFTYSKKVHILKKIVEISSSYNLKNKTFFD